MSRRTLWLVALLALALLALTTSGGGTAVPGSAARPGSAVDSSFAALTSAHGRSPLAISIASGRDVYDRYCAICHGETGGGDGFNAYNVKDAYGTSPAVFSDSAFVATLADSVALTAIRAGGPAVGKSPAMPAWGRTLTPGERLDVWHYARSLADTVHAR